LKPTYKIENIVASADLPTEIDLYILGKLSFDIDYEPEQFPGAIFKIHNPSSALLIFKNGKIICTGTKTREDVRRAVQQAVDLVKRYKRMVAQNPKLVKAKAK
jgi:transcription initiation factor TFIID TATA-box-binding protein